MLLIVLDMTGSTFPAYTNGSGIIVTYSNGGCDIITGGNVGWGGPNAPGTPVNNPRNFNGSITFSSTATIRSYLACNESGGNC
ncbi:MAG: hypothetical protein R2765_03410 [Ferruginibacter sp.]